MDGSEKLAKSLAAARAASQQMSEQVTREYVRDYLISHRIVHEVDNQGETCEHCTHHPISSNVYAHIHRQEGGTDVEVFQTCTQCVLWALDTEWDVATEYMVIVESVRLP